jgi:glycosyltransferase involved in cell wall biosynthesis
MNVIILTQYFPPETGAPQNRLFALAKFFNKKGDSVKIITASPSYPKSEIFNGYKNQSHFQENIQNIEIHRTWIFISKSSRVIMRLLNYFSFVISSFLVGLKLVDNKTDLIICESPPLFLGITAVLLKKIKSVKLLFNVSDLWPKTAVDLGIINNAFIIKISIYLEEWIYKNSDMISCQTNGIKNDISSRIRSESLFWYKNGYDFNNLNHELNDNWRSTNNFSNKDFIILYAGIIGHAQGLEVCLKAANELKNIASIKFVIIGSGPELDYLKKIKQKCNLVNVSFLGHQSKNELFKIIPHINAGLIPLKKIPIFEGAIPSKIFDILGHKKPIILGVEGEAKRIFIDDADAGVFYEPENFLDLKEKIIEIKSNNKKSVMLGKNGYNYIKKEFDIDKILEKYHTWISNELL